MFKHSTSSASAGVYHIIMMICWIANACVCLGILAWIIYKYRKEGQGSVGGTVSKAVVRAGMSAATEI